MTLSLKPSNNVSKDRCIVKFFNYHWRLLFIGTSRKEILVILLRSLWKPMYSLGFPEIDAGEYWQQLDVLL